MSLPVELPAQELYTVPQAAKLLGWGSATLYRKLDEEDFPLNVTHHLGGQKGARISRKALIAYVEAMRVAGDLPAHAVHASKGGAA